MSASLGGASLRGFRLSDIPESVRRSAAERILRSPEYPPTLADRLQLGQAVANPSPRVYWVTQAAWEREARKQTWRRPP